MINEKIEGITIYCSNKFIAITISQVYFLIVLHTHVGELGALFCTIFTQRPRLTELLVPVPPPTAGQGEGGTENQAELLKGFAHISLDKAS